MNTHTERGSFGMAAAPVPFGGLVAPVQFVAEGIISAAGSVAGMLGEARDRARRARMRRETIRALGALDERILTDIGVSRPMIRALATELAELQDSGRLF